MAWKFSIDCPNEELIAVFNKLCEERILDRVGNAYYEHGWSKSGRPIAVLVDGSLRLNDWAEANLQQAIDRHRERCLNIIRIASEALNQS